MASLLEFLKTGRLGALATGMSEADVRALLGEPEDISVQKVPRIWKYGSLELSFVPSPDGSGPILVSIIVYFRDSTEHPPAALAPTGWTPSSDTTFEEFRACLVNEGIPISGGVETGPDKHLVLGSAVRVTFDEDRLHSIGHTAKREPEFKQLTIKVRRKDLELIRQLADGQFVSASDLCSKWVSEQVSQYEKEKMGTP